MVLLNIYDLRPTDLLLKPVPFSGAGLHVPGCIKAG
jgi:hypothetical protein